MSDAGETVYKLRDDVLSVPVGSENVLLAMGSDKYFGVRGAMRHLLEGLREGMSLEAMIAATCATYTVDPAVARRDLEAALQRLADAKLLAQTG